MTEQLTLPFPLHKHGTFERFVAGRNGELVERLRRVGSDFECLWLFGERGTGKTHLLQAVCHDRTRAAYIPAREMVAKHGSIQAYGQLDTVTIDDVTHWVGDLESEQALMDLYNVLRGRRARLVVAADRSARDVDFALPDLGSRLRAAAGYRVEPLDDEDKLRLLDAVADERGLELPLDVARFLLARTSRDQRELLRVLDRLDKASLAEGRRLTVPFVKKTLRL